MRHSGETIVQRNYFIDFQGEHTSSNSTSSPRSHIWWLSVIHEGFKIGIFLSSAHWHGEDGKIDRANSEKSTYHVLGTAMIDCYQVSDTVRECAHGCGTKLQSLFEKSWLPFHPVNNCELACRVLHTLSTTPVAQITTPLNGLGHKSKTLASSLPA